MVQSSHGTKLLSQGPGVTTAPAVSTNVAPDKRDTNSHGTGDLSHPEEQVQVVAWTKHDLYSKPASRD
jgi:hypothetical protein